MPVEYLTPRIEDQAFNLQLVLAERGPHRAPSVPDLLIAATAELADLTVLHLHKDFDLIAEITCQRVDSFDDRLEAGRIGVGLVDRDRATFTGR